MVRARLFRAVSVGLDARTLPVTDQAFRVTPRAWPVIQRKIIPEEVDCVKRLDNVGVWCKISIAPLGAHRPKWRNRQTRCVQGAVGFMPMWVQLPPSAPFPEASVCLFCLSVTGRTIFEAQGSLRFPPRP